MQSIMSPEDSLLPGSGFRKASMGAWLDFGLEYHRNLPDFIVLSSAFWTGGK